MRKTLLISGALTALLVASPVLAEDVAAPAAPDQTLTTDQTKVDKSTVAAVAKPKFIGQQAETELLASHLIGSTVYGPADETLGDINDIVLAKTGGIEAVIVGVGGFLGMGEKNVAVSFEALTETTDPDGNIKLVLATTVEELNAAPAYVTVAMLRQEELDKKAMEISPVPEVPTN